VAIRADDLTALNLFEDALPSVTLESVSDRESLLADVVELEDDRVDLSTVPTGMLFKVGEKVLRPFARDLLAEPVGPRYVSLTVGAVMLGAVRGSAGAAKIVALGPIPAPRELVRRLLLSAPTALEDLRIHGEHMFPPPADGTSPCKTKTIRGGGLVRQD
jgi:hypothetical protein